MKQRAAWMILFPMAIIAFIGCATSPSTKEASYGRLDQAFKAAIEDGSATIELDAPEEPGIIQPGDLAVVHVRAVTEKGTVLVSTDGDSTGYQHPDEAHIKARLFPGPVCITAGSPALLPQLSMGLVGMEAGQKKELVLTPESGFGERSPELVDRYARMKRLPVDMGMPLADYRLKFEADPAVGERVPILPYFDATVKEVTASNVTLHLLAAERKSFPEDFGVTEVVSDGNFVYIHLVPRLGDVFKKDGRAGYITAIDEKAFEVDFNPPLAGKTITIALETVSIKKRSENARHPVEWVEDWEAGVSAAESRGARMLLVLYSKGCPWCRRLLEDTQSDSLIRDLSDDFVWVKIDSEENPEYKAGFEQTAFPTALVLSEGQKVLKRIEGYRSPFEFRCTLQPFLTNTGNEPQEIMEHLN